MIRNPLLRRRRGHVVRAEGFGQGLGAVGGAAELTVLERQQDKRLQGLFRDEDLILPVHQRGGVGAGIVVVGRDVPVLRLQDFLQGYERMDDLPQEGHHALLEAGLAADLELAGEPLVRGHGPVEGDLLHHLDALLGGVDAVQDEDVDKDAPVAVAAFFHTQGPDVVDLREIQRIILVGPAGQDLVVRVVIFLAEPLVVRAGHPDVDVVVPGNVSLVPDGAEQGTIGQIVPQPLLVAEALHVLQDVHHVDEELVVGYFFHITKYLGKAIPARLTSIGLSATGYSMHFAGLTKTFGRTAHRSRWIADSNATRCPY